jgi:hypothetical protein
MRLENDMRTRTQYSRTLRSILVLTAVAIGTACFGEPAPVVVIDYTLAPPDTTAMEMISVEGRVVRAPPLAAARFAVEITGGVDTVDVDADDFGLFTAEVLLNPRTTNNLVVQARDNTGVRSEPRTWVVVHVEEVPGTAPADPGVRNSRQ